MPRPSANDSQLQVPPASVNARSAEVAFAAGTGARVGSALGAGVCGAGDALGDGVSAGEGMGEGEGAGVALERRPRPRPFGPGVGDAIVAAVGNGIGSNAGVGEGDGAGAVWPLCAISNRVPGAPLENPHNPTAAVATAKARVREKRRIPGILCFRIRRSSRGADRAPCMSNAARAARDLWTKRAPMSDRTSSSSSARSLDRRTFVALSGAAGAVGGSLSPALGQAEVLGRPHAPLVAEDDPAISVARPQIRRGSRVLESYYAAPRTAAPATPAVVLAQAIWGIDAQLRDTRCAVLPKKATSRWRRTFTAVWALRAATVRPTPPRFGRLPKS